MKNKILLIEDELDLAKVTKIRLENSGYEVVSSLNGEEAFTLLQKDIPDLILLDLLLPGMRGEEICKKFKCDDRLKNIPVILFTASVSDIPKIAKEVGAVDYIMKPVDPEVLLSKVKKFIRKSINMSKRILIIDDEIDSLKVIAMRLETEGYEVGTASNGAEAFNLIREKAQDLILLDVMMPDMDGFEVKERLNKDASTASIPVIFLTAKDTLDDKMKGFNLGIDDYITKPYNPAELLMRINSAIIRRKFYEEISMTDGLTGLYNTHFFKKQIGTFFAIAKRYKQVFSLALIDINKFKSINDSYGHMAGDGVLKSFSSIAKKVFRQSDIITRYGGDEFAVILPGINEEQAKKAIDRLKNEIDGKTFSCDNSDISISFSISVGIAEYKDSLKDENELFESADAAMYEDKRIKKQS